MKKWFFPLFIFLLFSSLTADEAVAQAPKTRALNVGEAVRFLEKQEQILEKWAHIKPKRRSPEFKKKDTAMKQAVEDIIDYKFIAGYIIGDKWDSTPEDKKEALFNKIKDLFTELYLEDTFYNKSYEKKYIDKGLEKMYIKGVPESVSITTEVQASLKGKPVIYELIYHLRLVNDNYKVFDIEVDTVSIIRNYKEQFKKNVKNQSVDELIKMIDKKIKNKKREGSIFEKKKVS